MFFFARNTLRSLVFLVCCFTVVFGSTTLDPDHFCNRMSTPAQLNFQAIVFTPPNLVVVESKRVYQSESITDRQVILKAVPRSPDWLQYFNTKSLISTTVLESFVTVDRARIRWLHQISFGANQNLTVFQSDDLRTYYLIYMEDSKEVVQWLPIKSKNEAVDNEHRAIGSYLFFHNTRIYTTPSIQFIKLSSNSSLNQTTYVDRLAKNTLIPELSQARSGCWIESPSAEKVEVKCDKLEYNRPYQLLNSVPLGFSKGGKMYLVDVTKAVVHVITDELELVNVKDTISFHEFFGCSGEYTKPPTSQSKFQTWIIIVVCVISILIGLILGLLIMYYVFRKRSPFSRLATWSAPNKLQFNNTKKKGDKWQGQFLLTLEKHHSDGSRPLEAKKKKKKKSQKNKKEPPPDSSTVGESSTYDSDSSRGTNSLPKEKKLKKREKAEVAVVSKAMSSVAESPTVSSLADCVSTGFKQTRAKSDPLEEVSQQQSINTVKQQPDRFVGTPGTSTGFYTGQSKISKQ